MLDVDLDLTAIQAYAEEENLAFVVLFGSRARGAPRPGSDFDVALMPDDYRSLPRRRGGELACRLRRCDMDVVWLGEASWLLASEVARDGIVLYEKRPFEFATFRTAAQRRYADSRVWRWRQVEGLRRAIYGGKAVNLDLIREKLGQLMVFLGEARELAEVPKERFVADFRATMLQSE